MPAFRNYSTRNLEAVLLSAPPDSFSHQEAAAELLRRNIQTSAPSPRPISPDSDYASNASAYPSPRRSLEEMNQLNETITREVYSGSSVRSDTQEARTTGLQVPSQISSKAKNTSNRFFRNDTNTASSRATARPSSPSTNEFPMNSEEALRQRGITPGAPRSSQSRTRTTIDYETSLGDWRPFSDY
jgi:hypothetical protein